MTTNEPGVCNGRCIGHASELSTSEWKPDPACPLHGRGQQPAQPESGDVARSEIATLCATIGATNRARVLAHFDRLQFDLAAARGELDAANQHVRILQAQREEHGRELTAAQQRIAALHEALRGEGESAEGWTDDDYLQAAREGDADAREVGRLAGKLAGTDARIAALERENTDLRARLNHSERLQGRYPRDSV